MKTSIPPVLITFAVVCFALVQNTQGVSPPPDGGYPGANTAEGQNALLSLTGGLYNTAVGFSSLKSNNIGNVNTAIGVNALTLNTTGSNNTASGVNALYGNRTGVQNTANGGYALFGNTIGGGNTAIGMGALFSNTTGNGNIALGASAGINLTTGDNNIEIGNVGAAGESNTIRLGDLSIHGAVFVAGITAATPAAPNQVVLVDSVTGKLGSADIATVGVVTTSPENTAVGDQALVSSSGGFNTAEGFRALFSNTIANYNTAVGAEALLNNRGNNNTAVGALALSSNTGDPSNGSGVFNNAVGANSLFFNTIGSSNNAFGESALFNNSIASGNTALGDLALGNNDGSATGDASANTAVGAGALFSNVDGDSNNALGFNALGSNINGSANSAIGVDALSNATTGSLNVAIGDSAGQNVSSASNVICIGANVAGGNVSNSCFIGSIFGQTSSAGSAVFINSDGKLGTTTSSQRFKEQIRAMDSTSEAIFALKPVTFRYKKEIDPAGISQFGLVAEDVEKVNPDLVVRDKEGKPYSVRYEQVNAMLLNEFLKEHRKNKEQEATITQLRKELQATAAHQQKQIEALTTGLRKVNARLEMSRPAPQVAESN
jgi:trimeric autotransporter adhesin